MTPETSRVIDRILDPLSRDYQQIKAVDRAVRLVSSQAGTPPVGGTDAPILSLGQGDYRRDWPERPKAEGITCPTCFGDKYVMCPPPHQTTCPECDGTGLVAHLGDLDLARNPYRTPAPITTPVSKLSPETLKLWANPPKH